MLVLTRKPGEKICVGGDVAIVVLEVKGNRVRLGINAPRSVTIMRTEVHERQTDVTAANRQSRELHYAVGHP